MEDCSGIKRRALALEAKRFYCWFKGALGLLQGPAGHCWGQVAASHVLQEENISVSGVAAGRLA